MQAHLERVRSVESRSDRPQTCSDRLSDLARAAQGDGGNIFGAVVAGAAAGATHGEICATLRRELGFGHPLVVI